MLVRVLKTLWKRIRGCKFLHLNPWNPLISVSFSCREKEDL